MSEEIHLVTELAIILIAAGVFTVISKALKQPLILGYIVAGIIVGPHLGLFPQFSTESVHQWSELGIIFLLFSLGLEFSFKKLLKVGSAALIAAGTICAGMFILSIATGRAMGWSMMESIFLGGMLSMSSTSIIIKVYGDLGLKDKPYAPLTFGILVVEDLIAVVLLVLLSTLAISNKFSGTEMLMGIAKLVFCLILWFLVGIYVIPTLLNKARKYLSDEILLLVSIGLCFLMVVIANLAGFSSALGAFLMGSILSSSLEGERIEKLTGSIKDLFGAIFFVSVGMMVDPKVIGDNVWTVLIITIVAMTGILAFSSAGVLLAGKGLKNAVHVGFSLAQLGEFSFIIAGLGTSLGVVGDFIYPVIIAVSVITTFTTPYMIKAADPVCAWLYKVLPEKVIARIDPPQDLPEETNKAEQNEWTGLLKKLFIRVGLYGVILIAILIGSEAYMGKLALKLLPTWSDTARNFLQAGITLALMFPFLYGMAVNGDSLRTSASRLIRKDPRSRWAVLFLILIRIFIAIGFVLAVILRHFQPAGWTVLLIIVAAILFFIFARGSVSRVNGLEERFMNNLNEREAHEKKIAPVASMVAEQLAGYDVHIEPVVVSADSEIVGKSLAQVPFRGDSGVNIVKIQRGSRSILIPSGGEVIYPADKLLAVGTTEQIQAFRKSMKDSIRKSETEEETFAVEAVTLTEESSLTGQTLRSANMRASGCMCISILHEGKFTTNPKPDYKMAAGDTVWIAGLASAVEWYKRT